jgi:hypothetical protein
LPRKGGSEAFEASLEREEITLDEYLDYFESQHDAMTEYYENDETLNEEIISDIREGGEEEPMGLFKFLERV